MGGGDRSEENSQRKLVDILYVTWLSVSGQSSMGHDFVTLWERSCCWHSWGAQHRRCRPSWGGGSGRCGGARATLSSRAMHADAIFGDVQMLRGTCTSLRQTGAGFLLIFDPPIECLALFFTRWPLPPLRVSSAGVDGTRCDQEYCR